MILPKTENLSSSKTCKKICIPTKQANEDFLTCCWSIIERKNVSVLLTAGKRGVIRIFQPYSFENNLQNWDCLIGHTSAINQLKISSRKPFLLASASSDRSSMIFSTEIFIKIFILISKMLF